MSSPNYITPQGLARLKQEFEELFYNERPKLVETIAWAASNGDRSENGDYIYGKRRLRQIDSRLRFLRDRIEAAQVVDPTTQKSDRVLFGAIVEVEFEDGTTQTYQIVGEDEIEIGQNKISWKSPMAKALLGKTCGEEILVKRPKGDVEIVINSISYKK